MRPLTDDKLRELTEITPKDLKVISRFSGGSRAIADALAKLLLSGMPRDEQLTEAGRITAEVLTHTLKELGPELLAWLEHWVVEYNVLRVSTADLRNGALQELRASGVAEIRPLEESVEFFASPHTAAWRKALNVALSDLLEAPMQWESVVADLFFIERFLRRALTSLLEKRYGRKWQTRLPDDMQNRIIGAFRQTASARITTIADIDRPLDWVTLGDLFELIPRFSPSDHLEGLSATEWRTLADSVLPVRNRVSHMRLLRDTDRQAIRNAKWRISTATSDLSCVRGRPCRADRERR
jgi:hypothetical protein